MMLDTELFLSGKYSQLSSHLEFLILADISDPEKFSRIQAHGLPADMDMFLRTLVTAGKLQLWAVFEYINAKNVSE